MSVTRFVEFDLVTGERGTCESRGGGETAAAVKARLESERVKIVALTDYDIVDLDLAALTEERREMLTDPKLSVIALPDPFYVAYDPATGGLRPSLAGRPTFEQHTGTVDRASGLLVEKTVAMHAAEIEAREDVPASLAALWADALKAEYDAYDPLEGVHPYGTSIEDIFAAAIVAAERRAARRAADA